MKVLLSEKQRKKGQRGFTLVEFMIAIAVSAMIMVGSMQLLSHMVVTSAQNRAETTAMLQVQYVGFWITEDVVQARPDGISLGGAQGFPLTIQWTQWNGVEHKVVYSVEPETFGSVTLWTLYRQDYTAMGSSVPEKLAVGEYLDPAGTPCAPVGTRCEWVTGGDVIDNTVLKLDVSAVGDPYGKDPVAGCYKYEVSRTYEINPRSK